MYLPEEEDVETIAGLVTHHLERISKVGDHATLQAVGPRRPNKHTVKLRVERMEATVSTGWRCASCKTPTTSIALRATATIRSSAHEQSKAAWFWRWPCCSAMRSLSAPSSVGIGPPSNIELETSTARAWPNHPRADGSKFLDARRRQLASPFAALVLGAVGEPLIAHALQHPLQTVGVSDFWLHGILR